MHVADDIYLGGFPPGQQPPKLPGQVANPTVEQGVGPLGRLFVYNIAPLTKQAASIAALQHMTNGTALTLAAGTGVTKTTAPDGSGSSVYAFDVERSVSLTSTANLSAINFTIVGYDMYGNKLSQVKAGPNNNTVNTLKGFLSVLSVTPNTTDGANNVSVGSADIFGLPFVCADAGYLMPKWNNTLAQDAGTFVVADATSPATTATGDVRGTYLPSSASDGTKRLVLWHHLIGNQCGASATLVGAIGVAQV